MKRKGSTLITVVALSAILFTTATAILSLTYYALKLKNVQSRKLENLYGAESGIDASKKILELSAQSAVKVANLEVINKTNEINNQIQQVKSLVTESRNSREIINEIVSSRSTENGINYKVFLKDENGDNTEVNTLYYIEASIVRDSNNELKEISNISLESVRDKQRSVFTKKYKEILNSNLPLCFENYSYKYISLDSNNTITRLSFSDFPNDSKVSLEYTPFESNDYAQLKFKSVFTTPDKIERSIEANYKLSVPDLTVNTSINNPLLSKAIAVDGNMYINSNFDVNGDMFVRGIEADDSVTEDVYSKYEGGIYVNISKEEVTNSSELDKSTIRVNFNGNVSTPSTLNIKQESQVNVNSGNLYVNNLNLGRLNSTDTKISNNILNIERDLVVDNDFTYNANETKVTINNLYAINERSNTVAKKSSSSIIINSPIETDKSEPIITIKKDAYIRGTAYVNAKNESDKKYQTGESTAVKGNYLAYTFPIIDEEKNEYGFGYYSPLQLVDTKNNNSMTLQDKANYFLQSTDENGLKSSGSIKLDGELSNFYISGAYINNGNVQFPTGDTEEKKDTLIKKRKEYANKVYEMDSFNEYTPAKSNNKLEQIYNDFNVNKSVINLIDIGSAEKEIYTDKNNIIVAVYKDDGNHTPLILTDETGSGVNINKKKGIIITDRDIKFDNRTIEFTGTIISTKSISTTGSKITINYDEALVKNFVDQYNLFSIFNSGSLAGDVTSIKLDNGDIDTLSLIKNNGWRIEK